MQKFVIFGRCGQLAKHLDLLFQKKKIETRFIGSSDVDFSNLASLQQFLDTLDSGNISCMINAAAFTNVELAEVNNLKALQINAFAPAIIANYAAKNNIPLVHFSTDYVFNGDNIAPYTEDDLPNPINTYGYSKLLGDLAIINSRTKYLILRTSWVFSEFSTNFVRKILQLANTKEELRIVADQVGCPSYAGNLAKIALQLINKQNWRQVINVCDQPVCSWYELTKACVDTALNQGIQLKVKKIIPINSDQYKTKAQRPKNSVLSTEKLQNTYNIKPLSWKDAISHMNLKEIINS